MPPQHRHGTSFLGRFLHPGAFVRALGPGPRTFLMCFVPMFAAIVVSSIFTSASVERKLSENLTNTLSKNEIRLQREIAEHRKRVGGLIQVITDSAELKVSLGLFREVLKDSEAEAQVYSTVRDQLRELSQRLGYELLIARDNSGRTIVYGNGFIPAPGRRSAASADRGEAGYHLLETGLGVYECVDAPVELGSELIGSLSACSPFDLALSASGDGAVLLRGGRVILANVPGRTRGEIEQGLRDDCVSGDAPCQARIGGERYVAAPLARIDIGGGYRIVSFQSLDKAMAEFTAGYPMLYGRSLGLGLALAALLSWIAARLHAKPLNEILKKLEGSRESGEMPTDLPTQSYFSEMNLIARQLNWTGAELREAARIRAVQEEQLRQSEERYALAAEGSNDGLWDWDLRSGRIYFSRRWKAMLGYADRELGDSPEGWLGRLHPEDRERVEAELEAYKAGRKGHLSMEYRALHSDNAYRWMLCRGTAVRDSTGIALRLAGSQTDITRGKVADPLTGLPNRILMTDRIAAALVQKRMSPQHQFALFFLDLDRFKLINDSLGHLAGDKLLVETSRRLSEAVRSATARTQCESTVARLGGDEFCVLLNGFEDAGLISHCANRILENVGRAVDIGGQHVFASVSIGIANGSSGYALPADVIRDADLALYKAKKKGKARFEVFDSSMHEAARRRVALEADLRQALDEESLRLHFQPILDLATNTMAGCEALLRWPHPKRGHISPAEFIPMAEEIGLMIPLGEWVLQQACSQVAAWIEDGVVPHDFFVSVNLSGRQLAQADLKDRILATVQEAGLSPECLRLELTETVLMTDREKTAVLFRELQQAGIISAIDDFGTGYSSLSYLQKMPFETVKLDRSFVAGMMEDGGAGVVRQIVALAQSMGKHVVAEGIEVEEQRRLLTGFGCEYAQGYLFSKPVSAEEFVALTRGWNPMHSLVSLGVAVDGAPVEAGSESMAMQPARP